MSYDLQIGAKLEGIDMYAILATPKYDNPTYNLGQMFRACTEWNFKQDEWYSCQEVLPMIEHGIKELRLHPEKYKQYEPENGWGTIGSAIRDLESLRDCIYGVADENDWSYYPTYPIEILKVRW